jgi:formylglycine-generating enzyme
MKTPHVLRSTRVRAGALLAAGLAIWAAVAEWGCQIVGGYKPFQAHPCDPLPAYKQDPRNIATLVLSKQPDGTCYWIDQTEVTVSQYVAFVNAVAFDGGPGTVRWDPACVAWKTTPSNPTIADASDQCALSTMPESEPFRETKPIRCVDWCDARAFCQWAGKDLCSGDDSDSTVAPQDLPDQWGGACSANGWAYVNGTTPVYGACNVGVDAGQCLAIVHQFNCAPVDVDSFPQCTSPSGAVDMIGNVAEWVLQCGVALEGGSGDESSLCQYRGGSFATDLVGTTCYEVAGTVPYDPRGTRDRSIGFRCCAPLTQGENNQRLK